MTRQAEAEAQIAGDTFKQRMVAAAFGSYDPKSAMDHLQKVFDKEEKEEDVEEYVPENEADVEQMLGQVRRLGIVE